MDSNTANNSASESVNTRPRLKAYLYFIDKLKVNQSSAALLVGYILVSILFYNLGRTSAAPDQYKISVEEPTIDLSSVYNNLNNLSLQQWGEQGEVAGESTEAEDQNCEGKIKGNISASSKIYHLPGGSFYKRTHPEMCFESEQEAKAAGFRKSKR